MRASVPKTWLNNNHHYLGLDSWVKYFFCGRFLIHILVNYFFPHLWVVFSFPTVLANSSNMLKNQTIITYMILSSLCRHFGSHSSRRWWKSGISYRYAGWFRPQAHINILSKCFWTNVKHASWVYLALTGRYISINGENKEKTLQAFAFFLTRKQY